MYKYIKLRPGFWIVVNLYSERLYEGHTLAECRAWVDRHQEAKA